jgi:hypothetical protein
MDSSPELGGSACACRLGQLRADREDLDGSEAAYRVADDAGDADGSVQFGLAPCEQGSTRRDRGPPYGPIAAAARCRAAHRCGPARELARVTNRIELLDPTCRQVRRNRSE